MLKDIKRWLKLYDEKMNRLDVARCLAEANLVKGDLLEILATWPEQDGEDRIKAKVALACRMFPLPPHSYALLSVGSRITRATNMAVGERGNADHS